MGVGAAVRAPGSEWPGRRWEPYLSLGVAETVRAPRREGAVVLARPAGGRVGAPVAPSTKVEVPADGAPLVALEGVDATVPGVVAAPMARPAGVTHALRVPTA